MDTIKQKDSITIGVLVGSARKKSFSMAVARAVMDMLPDTLSATLLPIAELPMYNQDLDDDGMVPASWKAFREAAKGMDGYLFITPEYNRSIPPVLKNAIDIGSRPYGQSVFDGKPGGVISVSPGRVGGFGANHHLRQVMTCLNVPMMQQPEAYIGEIHAAIDAQGAVTGQYVQKSLMGFAEAFSAFCVQMKK